MLRTRLSGQLLQRIEVVPQVIFFLAELIINKLISLLSLSRASPII